MFSFEKSRDMLIFLILSPHMQFLVQFVQMPITFSFEKKSRDMLMVTSWKSASWSATAIVEDCAERGCLKVLKIKNMYQKTFEYWSESQKHVSENI